MSYRTISNIKSIIAMGSFYNDASLIVTPNGVGVNKLYSLKPTDGSGDFTVTRATSATRVNSLGAVETPITNLFLQSEMFSQGIWNKINLTITANTVIAPDGTLTADTLRLGVDISSVRHRLQQSTNFISNTTYTTSYYLKKANHRWIQLVYVSDVPFTASNWVNFDLENGVIGNIGAGAIATITDVGNGWYRCTLQATALSSGTFTGCEVVTTNNTNSGRYPSYQSTVAEDVCYVWGAQLEQSNRAGEYIPTTSSVRTKFQGLTQDGTSASNIARLDYSNGTCPAILVEPQSRNEIRNNTMVGAVVGNTGTLPTNWTQSLIGLTREVVGLGVENGVEYVDLRLSGTAGGAGTALQRILFEPTTQIVAATGQTWTLSSYVKVVSQPQPPTFFRLLMFELTSIGGFVAAGFQNITPTTTLQRFSYTRTLSGGATVARVQPILEFVTTTGQSYDFTVRIGMPQMEQQAFQTSVIPTSTVAVTRNADVITRTGATDLIGQTEGTIFLEFYGTPYPLGIKSLLVLFSDLATENITLQTSNNMQNLILTILTGGDLAARTLTPLSGLNKLAVVYSTSGTKIFLNGVQQAPLATTAIPAMDTIALGHRNNLRQWGGGINDFYLSKTQITDTEAIQLTTL
jgi:hypothetical protein